MCGEQWLVIIKTHVQHGSPPRVRGTALPCAVMAKGGRITPACAGNSPQGRGLQPKEKDHPRVCGEQCLHCPRNTAVTGSPPRVRGTVCTSQMMARSLRITPACAGNSPRWANIYAFSLDHPRVCGEQIISSGSCQPLPGSPPRVRGTDRPASQIYLPLGITPACAGNSYPGFLPAG